MPTVPPCQATLILPQGPIATTALARDALTPFQVHLKTRNIAWDPFTAASLHANLTIDLIQGGSLTHGQQASSFFSGGSTCLPGNIDHDDPCNLIFSFGGEGQTLRFNDKAAGRSFVFGVDVVDHRANRVAYVILPAIMVMDPMQYY